MSQDHNNSQPQSQTDTTAVDDIATREYTSDLPGLLGTIDTAISRIESALLAVGVLLLAVCRPRPPARGRWSF